MGAGALIGGGILGAAGLNLFGSSQQASAQESAADTMANAQLSGENLQYQEWLQQQQNMQPWVTAGQKAVNQLSAGTQPGGQFTNIPAFSFDPTQIANNPDYQFVQQQGANALASQGAASGNYGSGNMGTALEQFGQGNAATYMNQYYNQALNTYGANLNSQYTMPYNFLAGVSGSGQQQSQAEGQLGLQAANTMGQYGVGAANALGAGQVGAANAWASGYNNLSNQGMGAIGTYMNYNLLGNYLNAGGGGGGNSWDNFAFAQ